MDSDGATKMYCDVFMQNSTEKVTHNSNILHFNTCTI